MPAALAAQRPLDARAQTPARDSWFGEDKLQHTFASASVVLFAYGGARLASIDNSAALKIAIVSGALTGLWKEWRDRRSGKHFSARDLVWDAVGIGASAFLVSHARE